MSIESTDKATLNIEINIDELNSTQVRMIKSINSLLTHTLTTSDETEYFNGSSELLRLLASLIQKASFSKKEGHIDYGKQVLEYCSDILAEQVYEDSLVKYDN
ncbi:MAG: protein phosphatase 2A regulatory B subunit B56 family protein [Flavobacteriaceae bacterium]|nr:protein phosphatase 2A regulatory B subunit B56 family protein [Flavobacteriaceae bacterium]